MKIKKNIHFIMALVVACVLSGCGFPSDISSDPRVSSIAGKTFRLKEDLWVVDWRISDRGPVKIVSPDTRPNKIQLFKTHGYLYEDFEKIISKNKGKFPKGTIIKINRVFRERSTFAVDDFFVEFLLDHHQNKTFKIDSRYIFNSIPWAMSEKGEQFLIIKENLMEEVKEEEN